MAERLIAVGDVHGCRAALEGLLEVVSLRGGDRLILLGDYVDRGPDSRGVIDLVLDLRRSHDVVTLLGNHEEMMLGALERPASVGWWLRYGGRETLASYGPQTTPKDIPAEHREFLAGLQDYHEEDEFFFTHGGYVEGESLDRQPPEALRWTNLAQRMPGPHTSGKTAVVGHSSQKNGQVLDAGHLICIDTFCHGGGRLTAIDALTRKTWQVDRDGVPV